MMVQWKEDRSERGQPGEDLGGWLGGYRVQTLRGEEGEL